MGRKLVNKMLPTYNLTMSNRLKLEKTEKMKLLLLKFEKPGKINKKIHNIKMHNYL